MESLSTVATRWIPPLYLAAALHHSSFRIPVLSIPLLRNYFKINSTKLLKIRHKRSLGDEMISLCLSKVNVMVTCENPWKNFLKLGTNFHLKVEAMAKGQVHSHFTEYFFHSLPAHSTHSNYDISQKRFIFYDYYCKTTLSWRHEKLKLWF